MQAKTPSIVTHISDNIIWVGNYEESGDKINVLVCCCSLSTFRFEYLLMEYKYCYLRNVAYIMSQYQVCHWLS
jgi:hypothetical protein